MSRHNIRSRINTYRSMIMSLTQKEEDETLYQIISDCPAHLKENVDYDDRWDNGEPDTTYYELRFFLSKDIRQSLKNLDQKEGIEAKIKELFNRASYDVDNEFIYKVYIDLESSIINYQDIIHPLDPKTLSIENTDIWLDNYIRLFISHKSEHKEDVSKLSGELKAYGISSFVAHTDIVPTREWRLEIEKALRSTDIFLAFITEDFFSSDWTNQEIGFAVARGIPIIPLMVSGVLPRGFLSEIQAQKGQNKEIEELSQLISDLIRKDYDKDNMVKKSIIESFKNSKSFKSSIRAFDGLEKIKDISHDGLIELVDAYNKNDQLNQCKGINNSNKFFNFIKNSIKHEYYSLEKEENTIKIYLNNLL
jgi:nucleoside 2-deoxyribosyltransferase